MDEKEFKPNEKMKDDSILRFLEKIQTENFTSHVKKNEPVD